MENKLCLSADDLKKSANQGWEDGQEWRNTIDVGRRVQLSPAFSYDLA
jgi:hypothetical protein